MNGDFQIGVLPKRCPARCHFSACSANNPAARWPTERYGEQAPVAQKEASRTAFCLAALSNPLPRDLIACHALLCPFRLHSPAPVFALPFLFLSSLTPPTIFFSPCLTLTTKESRKTTHENSLYRAKSLMVIFDFHSLCFPKERNSL